MKAGLSAFLAGLLFSIGLALGGMTQPEKIFSFLDFRGAWDPSLAFVMAGAIAIYAPARWLIRRRGAPLLAPRFQVLPPDRIDRRLLVGAAVFGVGWGLGGFCPGPGVVSLATGEAAALCFVASMLVGILAFRSIKEKEQARHPTAEDTRHSLTAPEREAA